MALSKRAWKKNLWVLVILVLALATTACSTTAVTPNTSSHPVTTTQSVLPPTTSQPTQTIVQVTPTPTPTPTTTPSPSPTPTTQPPPPTSPIYSPTAEPYVPTGTEAKLYQYMLGLINKDRQNAGLNPVVLSYNAAAHDHAKDMLENNYQAAHWGTDGLKPYMRYTNEGGLGYEQENSDYYSSTEPLDIEKQLKSFESAMMAEVAPNDSHRVNILNKRHQKVNLGIAYNANTVTLVQQFEGDYVEYNLPPTLNGNILSLTGHFLSPDIKLNNISIAYDAPPQHLTAAQLNQDQYHHYGLGQRLGLIFPPPPTGQLYQNLPANSIEAQKGSFDYKGWFYIEADISQILNKGPGVYTVVLVSQIGNETINMTNYSLFVE